MSTEIATTGSTAAGFTGADVDGLDRLSQEFTQAAQICDEVKTACEIIVAAASFFGPFGAAFVAYLKGTVIPWLQKISEALKLMAKVLSVHSTAQKDASSSATSLPSYTTPTNLPQTSTTTYPTLPAGVASGTGAGAASTAAPVAGTSSVATPPSIGGTTSGAAAAATPAAGTTGTPAVQAITALTGLVTAVDHLIHPGSPSAAGGAVAPVTAAGATGLGTSGLGTTGGIGSTGGIDVSSLTPLHPGDTVGVVSVPVDISPTGQITPLIHTPAATPGPVAAGVPAVGAAHAALAHTALAQATPVTHGSMTPHDVGASGGPSAGSTGLGGGSGSASSVPVVGAAHPSIAPVAAHVVAAHRAAAAHPAAEAGALTSSTAPGASHDGLYSGLGQATGLGAGGAALARATLHEARQRLESGVLGASPLPFDSAADGAARSSVFDGELH